jgi:hypothetical protein
MKKKSAKKKPTKRKPTRRTGQSLEPAIKIKDEKLVLQFRVAIAEYKSAEAVRALNLAALENEEIKPQYKFLNTLRQQVANVNANRNEKASSLQSVVATIAKKIKVPLKDMNRYTIDDQTGAVTKNPKQEQASAQGTMTN